MADAAVSMRFLRDTQNPDGGWGYFPGKQSWLEPTVYAALALLRDEDSRRVVGRVWPLLRRWQNPDGGWRPNGSVQQSTWATALAVTLAQALGEDAESAARGVGWLVTSSGAESSMLNRAMRLLRLSATERDVRHRGWPWRDGTSAWVEPTAHSLVALRRSFKHAPALPVKARVESGLRMLLSIRCTDGGWNYGSPHALGVDLPSYPETTALALIGLQDRAPAGAYDAARLWASSAEVSPFARAWLNIALQLAGDSPIGMGSDTAPGDIVLAALECLSAPEGNWDLLSAEADL